MPDSPDIVFSKLCQHSPTLRPYNFVACHTNLFLKIDTKDTAG